MEIESRGIKRPAPGSEQCSTQCATSGRQDDSMSGPEQSKHEIPEGGFRAWIVASGAAAIFFWTLGFANSFGTFEAYYLTHQLKEESASRISWIGSLATSLRFLTGVISGPLFDRYGAVIVQPAAVLYVFAVMMLSLCDKYWQIMLVQGILMSILMGVLVLPAFAAVAQYFVRKRAGALDLAVAGSSVGGGVIPIALSKMLNETSLGFDWTVRIIGFLMLPLMAFAGAAIKERFPSRKTHFWILSAFSEARFVILLIALFFVFFGMLTPIFYLPTFAITRGMDPVLAGYLLAIVNGASTFGRIIPGMLADKYGRLNMFALGGITTGMVVCCLGTLRSNTDFIVYSIILGFTSGTVITGSSAAFLQCPNDSRKIVNGALIQIHGGFEQVSVFSGALCVFGGVVALLAKVLTPEGLTGKV